MLIADIHHVSLNVSDVERSVAFYCDVLGLSELPRPRLRNPGAWLDAGNGRQIHLIRADVPDDLGQHVSFAVADLDATVAALTDAGVRISSPVHVGDTALRQSFANDPDGNRLEFTQLA